jgi:hypothetical protein
MKESLFLLTVLLVVPAVVFSQTETPSTSQDNNRQAVQQRNQVSITGCLTSSHHKEYQLVDQDRTTNLVFSPTVNLDAYVGQSVTLVGNRSATPSTDTGTARPMPHFMVTEVRPASGSCK